MRYALNTHPGHIFHAPCVQDWIETRTHDALKRGCPLCKRPATTSDLLALWPGDSHDFHQYVATHRSGLEDPEQPVLDAACDLVASIQTYAMAAHGLRAAPMQRVQHRISEALRIGAIKDKEASQAFAHAMDALHRMVTHVEGLSYTLAKAYTTTQQKAVSLHADEQRIRAERKALERDTHALRQDRHVVRQKHKRVAQAAAAVETRAAALAARERTLETEQAQALTRMHESVSLAKSASADAAQRAALREEAAERREAEALAQIHAAEEQAADATAALESIRQRNQYMADQMRELQSAVRRAQEKYRTLRAQNTQQSHTEASYRKRIAQLEARPREARSSDAEDHSSSPTRLVKRPRTARDSKPRSTPSLAMDDDDFPMPCGIVPVPHAPRAVPPLQDTTNTLALKGTWALGPRRRPR